MTTVFLFGTLCHDPLRDIVLDGPAGLTITPARLPGMRAHWVRRSDYPMLVADPKAHADGLLVEGLDDTRLARLDFFEAGWGYRLEPVTVEVSKKPVEALRYVCDVELTPGAAWSLSDWVDIHAPLFCASAEEAMGYFEEISPEELARRMPMIRTRAASRLRASESAPATVRSDRDVSRDVKVLEARRPYSNYFALDEHDLSFRRFDGDFSEPVNRAGFVGGDAVTVLPYDPKTDEVLVIEQFRVGPFFRGDTNPWMLEPIAGRIDAGEAVETTARREAIEEAGLALGALHFVNAHYPSPGAVTEYVYAYVAEADLSDQHGTVGGLDIEAEDIRSHVIPFDRLMELVESGEAGVGPLVISAYWLALNRSRLRQSA